MASKYDIRDPNRQFNDWDAVEQQIIRLDKRIDDVEVGNVDFENISGSPSDNAALKEAFDDKTDKIDFYALEASFQEVVAALGNKVDKVTGKELMPSDLPGTVTDHGVAILDLHDRMGNAEEAIADLEDGKVDKEEGKSLVSDDDITQITTNKEDILALQQLVANIPIIQLSEMPTPDSQYLGKIVQYIGPTASDFINGYFYQCGYDEETLSYRWLEKKVMNAAEEGGVDAYTKAETNQLLETKQDRLTSGEGIKIVGNVIMQDIIDDTLSSPQTTWSSRYLESLFHSLSGLSSIEIVNERPAQPVNNTLYYVKAYEEGEEPLYEIWFYSNNTWTKFGTTAIDLTNYYTKTEVDTLLANKQDNLTEGIGIDLTNNVASVKIDGTTLGVNDAGNLYVKSGGGGGGGGFEPTSAQLAAMNSGITQAKREDYDQAVEDVTTLQGDMTQAQSDIQQNADDITTLDTNKADKSTTYTKTEVDTALNLKADKSTTYTKTEVDTELAKKVDKRTSGTEVYSHSGDTQGAFTVKTSVDSTNTDADVVTGKAVNTAKFKAELLTMTVNTDYIQENYSRIYKVAGNMYMISLAFSTKNVTIPTNATLFTLPETISDGNEMYFIISPTANPQAVRFLQIGGTAANRNKIICKSVTIPQGFYFGMGFFIDTNNQ